MPMSPMHRGLRPWPKDAVDTTDIPEVGEEWFRKARLVLPAAFITDMGELPEADLALVGGRYGVWQYDVRRSKHQVAETGNELAALMVKYAVPAERVFPVRKP